jgi:hypothetical protein
MANDELEGNALNVYAYIVRADGPVGLRDVTRGAGLSSTSVAHYNLQKLEDSGLIEKNSYGQYTLRKKAAIDGHVWVGNNIMPQSLLYSFLFIGAFAAEVSILLLSVFIKSLVIETTFWFLMGITLMAMFLFIKEGLALYSKLNPKRTDRK